MKHVQKYNIYLSMYYHRTVAKKCWQNTLGVSNNYELVKINLLIFITHSQREAYMVFGKKRWKHVRRQTPTISETTSNIKILYIKKGLFRILFAWLNFNFHQCHGLKFLPFTSRSPIVERERKVKGKFLLKI